MNESRERKIERLTRMAADMRLKALDMALSAGRNGAHLGPAFSCAEIMAVLYGAVLRVDPLNPRDENRDVFIPSKAHCVLAYYTALWQTGFIKDEELAGFEKNGGTLAGHPTADIGRGIEYSGGSLGMALSYGMGAALDVMQKGRKNRVYILLGDGELDEGSNWETILAAPRFGLSNLTVIVDKNGLQHEGFTDNILPLGDVGQKFRAFDWLVTEVSDGHDICALLNAFTREKDVYSPGYQDRTRDECRGKSEDKDRDECRGKSEDKDWDECRDGKPRVIIANTVKGKGVSFMENAPEWHHAVLTQKLYEQAVAELRVFNLI